MDAIDLSSSAPAAPAGASPDIASMVTSASPAPPLPPPAPAIPAVAPSAALPILQTAWPRSAQGAFVFLLALTSFLLVLQVIRSARLGSRPTDLERGAGPGYRIDLNRASLAELMQIPAVGKSLGERIIRSREQQGGFRRVGDLLRVKGIGPATFERMQAWVCVNAADEDEDVERPVQPIKRAPVADEKKPNKKAAELKGKININTASADELRKLPRVGAVMARRILEERAKDKFRSVDDLLRVRGIKQKTLALLKPYVTIGEEAVRVVAKAE